MNKLSILGLGVLFLAASCKKSDYLPQNTSAMTTSATAATSPATQWKSLTGWDTKNYDKSTVFTSKLQDSAITSPVLASGMVLAYKKTGTTINALPFQQTINGTTYFWYYQAINGGLQISANVSGTSVGAPSTDHSIVYYVITPQQLATLEAQGHTKAALMNLSFAEAAALLKH